MGLLIAVGYVASASKSDPPIMQCFTQTNLINTYVSVNEFREVRVPDVVHIWPFEECNPLLIGLYDKEKQCTGIVYTDTSICIKCNI